MPLTDDPAIALPEPPVAPADRGAPAGASTRRRASATWDAFKRLTQLSFPRRFAIVQFPNLPLILAFLSGQAGRFVHGPAHAYTASATYLAMTVWAYEELVHGVNWFRRLLGLAYVAILVVRVAHALHG
jgi:hypothetical protein